MDKPDKTNTAAQSDSGNLDTQLLQRIQAEQACLAAVSTRLKVELARYNFSAPVAALNGGLHNLQLRIDDFDGNQSLYGEWHDNQGHCKGSLLIHGSGQVYAELDVLQDHPTDKKWYVESVTCWGPTEGLKCELGLLPALTD